ncbi:TonB-dependent receptor plug domain-containing protein [Paracoccus methylarcula]|nr:TonB-dependent receptor [Paracoccus methylarcula]
MRQLAILAATATALPAVAQEIIVLPEITLTANREETELSRSGSSVSILTDEGMKARAAQPIAQSLSRLPGISFHQKGPLGTTGSLQLRGAPAQYLPVVMDGIDISDPAAGQPYFDIGGMTGAGIGRVELLRGAQSALYGSRAIAGVLSLQSLRPTEVGVQHRFAIEAGSYNTVLANYGVTFRQDGTDLAFSASRIHSDGFSAADENDGNFEKDGFDATRLSFYTAHEMQNGATVGINGFWERSEGEFDDFVGDVQGTPGDDYNERESYGLRSFVTFSTGAVDHELALTRYHMDRTNWSNGWGESFIGTRTKLSWQGAANLGESDARVIFGADTEKEKAKGNGNTRLSGVFAEITASLGDRVDVSASMRRDDHSRFGGFTSGRVAAVYRVADDLLFRAAIGNGFRAPSLYELFGPFGDTGLEREQSRTAEIGVEKRWENDNYLRVTAFWMEADHLIGWDDRDTPSWDDDGYAQVQGKARRKGVELDGRYAFGVDHALTAAYTYTDNDISSEWAEVPVHNLSLGLETSFTTGTTAAILLQHVADRPGDKDDFTTVDLLLSHPLQDRAEAYLRVENIFNEQYQIDEGYGTPDRSVYAGIRASF